MSFAQEIEAQGHARVLVVLKPKITRRVDGKAELALAETVDLQKSAAVRLAPCFRAFEDSRASQIAASFATEPVALMAGASPMASRAARAASAEAQFLHFPLLGIMIGNVDRQGLAALSAAKDEVASVVSPPEFSLISPIEEDAALAGMPAGHSWGITRMQVPALWAQGLTGKGVLVGHLDTGVDAAHPALNGAVNVFSETDYMGFDVPGAMAHDTGFHGTHTAGIIAGRQFNGSSFGVAPGALLASAVVIERGDTSVRVIAGLEWCLQQGCRIINLSLGVRGYIPTFTTVMGLLRQRGVLPIAAVGNEGPVTSRSPGNYREVVSVGACDELDGVWWSSSSQQLPGQPSRTVPDMVAPGAGVWSCVPSGGVRLLSGTSMAAPHVSGLAALLMEHKPGATVDEIESAIYGSCQRPRGASTIRANRGIPDAVAALAAL